MGEPFSLRDYQTEDLIKLINNDKFMLLGDPGTGKTPPVIVNQYRRWTQFGVKTVWVMPKSLMYKNVDEVLRFSNFGPDDVAVVDGTKKKVEAALNSDAKIFIMGPDRFKLVADRLPQDAIDVDEFHMCFGGAASQRTNVFLKYAAKARFVVMMTGTLVNGRLDTTWPAIHAIDPRYYPLGYKQFLARHAVLDEYDSPIFWKNHEHIKMILDRHGSRRTFGDVFGSQNPVYQPHPLQLSPRQKKHYDQFAEKAVLELSDAMVDGGLPGVHLIRSRQIMEHPRSFPSPIEEGKFVDIVNGERTAKEDWFDIQIQDHIQAGTPFVAFASLRPQQKTLYEQVTKAGVTVGLMDANASAKRRSQIDKDFRAGNIQSIIASPQIASVGFNWQYWNGLEVGHCIFMSLGYMDSDFIQSYRRFIREVRSQALRVSIPYYKDTVDENMMAILEKKSKDANKVDPTREVLEII